MGDKVFVNGFKTEEDAGKFAREVIARVDTSVLVLEPHELPIEFVPEDGSLTAILAADPYAEEVVAELMAKYGGKFHENRLRDGKPVAV